MPKFKADFTGVSEGGGFDIADGDYICKVKGITVETGPKAKYLKWALVIGTGPLKGKSINHITTLKPSALFGLRNTIISLGISVPKKAFDIDTAKYIGKILGITVYQKESTKNGQTKSFPAIAETWAVKKTAKGYVKAGDEPEEKEEEEEVEVEIDDTTDEGDDIEESDDIEDIEV